MLSFPVLLSAQLLNPVSWTFEAEKKADNTYEVQLKAEIKEGWYIYSANLESDEGPVPTSLAFEAPEAIELIGSVKEDGKKVSGYDALFDMNITKYSDKVTFVQQIKLPGSNKSIKGSVEFMTCDNNRCLPPKQIPFEIKL